MTHISRATVFRNESHRDGTPDCCNVKPDRERHSSSLSELDANSERRFELQTPYATRRHVEKELETMSPYSLEILDLSRCPTFAATLSMTLRGAELFGGWNRGEEAWT